MFCYLVFQQHLQPVCLLQFFKERSTLLAEDPSPLLDILSHGVKVVVQNQVNFFVTSITKLVYDVM